MRIRQIGIEFPQIFGVENKIFETKSSKDHQIFHQRITKSNPTCASLSLQLLPLDRSVQGVLSGRQIVVDHSKTSQTHHSQTIHLTIRPRRLKKHVFEKTWGQKKRLNSMAVQVDYGFVPMISCTKAFS